jgi:hypothetical protein
MEDDIGGLRYNENAIVPRAQAVRGASGPAGEVWLALQAHRPDSYLLVS